MDIDDAVLLGIIQGFTEWLPISSAAHVAIANNLLNINAPIELQVALNFGTIVALIAYMKDDLMGLIASLLRRDPHTLKLFVLIALAGIPTSLIGFAGKSWFEEMHTSLSAIGITLILNGVILFLTRFSSPGSQPLTPLSALAQGIGQGLSVAPGISRSGATISAGLFCGLEPTEAARFSFLIGLPALLVASTIELNQAALSEESLLPLAAGLLASAITGYFSIHALISVLKSGKFTTFSYYCIALGLMSFVLSYFSL
ncbi:MAG: undecaprenyl-diphosphate phosphatase [Candidatus Anstonellales archaeon]